MKINDTRMFLTAMAAASDSAAEHLEEGALPPLSY